jgi:hypothetical protein
MYNNGFGAYPQDDMGVNSYFGESDTNFFGDTSNDSFFGEGCGFTGVGNGEFFNESVGFSTEGSEVISESYGSGFGYSDMFMESSGDMFMETKVPVKKIKKTDDSITKKESGDDVEATKSTKSATYPKPGSVKPATRENLEALRKESMSKYDQEALKKALRDNRDW